MAITEGETADILGSNNTEVFPTTVIKISPFPGIVHVPSSNIEQDYGYTEIET